MSVAYGRNDGPARVVLLCSDEPQHRYLARALSLSVELVGVVIEPGVAQRSALWSRRRYRDWVSRHYHDLRQAVTGRTRYRRRYFESLCPEGSPVAPLVVDSINSFETAALLARLRPDVAVVCATTLIRPELIDSVPLMINVHGGCLPRYRGNHCIYFAYRARDYAHIASTLHMVTPKLDAGDIIDTIRPPIFPHDHDGHLYCRVVHAGIVRLIELLSAHRVGETIRSHPQGSGGQMFRNRDRTPYMDMRLWLTRRMGRHRVPHRLAETVLPLSTAGVGLRNGSPRPHIHATSTPRSRA